MKGGSRFPRLALYLRARATLVALLTLSLCFLIYPPYAAAAALAVLVGGSIAADCMARGKAKPELPWNARRSWAGFLAFAAGALLLCWVALYLCACPLFLRRSGAPELPFVWTLAVLAGAAGAALWSLEGPGPAALRVPLGAGGIVWLLALFLSFGTRRLPADTHVQPEVLLRALAVNGVLAAFVLLLRFADLPAAVLGLCLGTLVYFFAAWQGYVLLVLFVIGGSLLSRLGWRRKSELGAAEAREGQRGIANAAANLLVPALCCVAYPAAAGHPAFLMAYAGALAAAFADTASAELGVLSKTRPVLITSRKPVPHGTNGAVSALGFGAAGLACALVAGVAWHGGFFALALQDHVPATWPALNVACAIVIFAGMAGTLLDSLLGATIEGRWPGVGKGTVNLACTLTGALAAGGATCLWLSCHRALGS